MREHGGVLVLGWHHDGLVIEGHEVGRLGEVDARATRTERGAGDHPPAELGAVHETWIFEAPRARDAARFG